METVDYRDTRAVVAVIATRDRHEGLAALLDSFDSMTVPDNVDFSVVVVDNSEDANARPIVSDRRGCRYIHEPKSGIVYARNTSVEVALQRNAWALAFVDDDEWVSHDWLVHHYAALKPDGVDGVTGPVQYVLPDDVDPQLRGVDYFRARDLPGGAVVSDVATNNTLVKAHWFEGEHGLRFDARYSDTGGSDKHLFMRMCEAGGVIRWVPQGYVYERIPVQRANRRWVLQRDVRNAQLNSRLAMEFEERHRFELACRAVAQLMLGLVTVALGVVSRSPATRLSGDRRMAYARGTMRASLGHLYREYRRA